MILKRELDHENYLCSILHPEKSRETQIALRAFNLDIAHVADTVSEPVLGSGRLTWWRESINKIYKVILLKFNLIESNI